MSNPGIAAATFILVVAMLFAGALTIPMRTIDDLADRISKLEENK